MPIGLLGLGSNVGERRAHLQAALDALGPVGVRVLQSSSTYDTDPVGEVLDQPSFLNACLLVETELEPLQLLDAVKRLERELGRTVSEGRHGPRVIDIDVLASSDMPDAPAHRELARGYVIVPLSEIAPGLVIAGRTVAAHRAEADVAGVEKLDWEVPAP